MIWSNEETRRQFVPNNLEDLILRAIPRNKLVQRFLQKKRDVTAQFERGALEVLRVAKQINCTEAILKANSPSCGSGKIYDGTFSGKLIDGDGVTTKLLKQNGIKVITENDL